MASMDLESQVFRALGHPFRLQLLEALRPGEACVCHLTALFGKPQPYVSKQLAELRDAGLLLDRRDGLRIYYRLADASVGSIIDAVQFALLRTGKLKSSDLNSPVTAQTTVPGCECPNCSVA
jgi:ArsR family transcriptional regulator